MKSGRMLIISLLICKMWACFNGDMSTQNLLKWGALILHLFLVKLFFHQNFEIMFDFQFKWLKFKFDNLSL